MVAICWGVQPASERSVTAVPRNAADLGIPSESDLLRIGINRQLELRGLLDRQST
jgi:hypothetical protein